MDANEKQIRARESATAYVRGTESKDRTALIALLDAERAKSAAMLQALKRLTAMVDAKVAFGPEWPEYQDACLAIERAEGR